jgi:hypothetical protein
MKKLLLSTFALLTGIALSAQVSVWDGTAEPWTHGSGTPEDPYLIENAQQLAYLAEKTNESIYDGIEYRVMFADTCFLLTTDLDLGADAGLKWEPIAACGNVWWKGRFGGHFDGGGHSFSNLTISNETADFFGIFGYMDGGSLKNIAVEGNEIHIPHIYSYACGQAGVVLGYGSDVNIENCVNNADVVWDDISMDMSGCILGGLFGQLNNSTINGCHNNGNLSAPSVSAIHNGAYCGGLAGWLNDCTVTNCSNTGDIAIVGGEYFNDRYAIGGGLAGFMSGTITLCSNTGNVSVNINVWDFGNETVKSVGGMIGYFKTIQVKNCYCVADLSVTGTGDTSYTGGIIGCIAVDTLAVTVENCYYSGSLTADTRGGIAGRANQLTEVSNCYFINTIADNGYGTPKSESEMKSAAFVSLLNNGGDVYAFDELGTNNGYPFFAQYYAIDENETDNGLAVFPNPTSGIVTINSESLAHVAVVNIFGQTVIKEPCSGGDVTIDLSEQPAGIYFLNLTDDKGKMSVKKVVKE